MTKSSDEKRMRDIKHVYAGIEALLRALRLDHDGLAKLQLATVLIVHACRHARQSHAAALRVVQEGIDAITESDTQQKQQRSAAQSELLEELLRCCSKEPDDAR